MTAAAPLDSDHDHPHDELAGHFLEELAIGMTDVFSKTITETDILLYAGLSGDTNPMHVDHLFASRSAFKGRIAHGMLTAALISTVFGTRLPGPGSVYVSQTLNFKAPVRSGETVVARVTVKAIDPAKRFVTFDTVCTAHGKKVLVGEAVLMVPSKA